MKKEIQELKDKTESELKSLIESVRQEISQLVLEKKIAQKKDVNELSKKRKKLAVLLTVFRQKSK